MAPRVEQARSAAPATAVHPKRPEEGATLTSTLPESSAKTEQGRPEWPEELTRVPYWVFQRQDVYREEQQNLFRGPYWSYFCLEDHGPRKLRLAVLHGLVFGSFDEDVPDIEEYLGDEILSRIERVLGGRTPVVLGRFTQLLPNNWKLYMENVKDTYHASLLHTFFTTFRLNRLSQKGGVVVSDCGGHHVSYSLAADTGGREYEQAGMRAAQEGFGLEAPELLEAVDEFGDGIGLQILSVFPTFVLQQTRNSLAVRRLVPQGLEKTELVWTCFGFTTDDEAMTERRLRQANLIGPAGYISMEDGAAPGFVQRGSRQATDLESVVEMGGASVSSDDNRVTEAAVRGFWKAYRQCMGI